MQSLFKKEFILNSSSYKDLKSAFIRFLVEAEISFSSKKLIIFEEIVMNVLTHGKKSNATTISILLKKRNFGFSLLCVDNGSYFDLRGYTNKKRRSYGGLGIEIIQKLTSNLYYKRYKQQNFVLVLFS